MLRDELTEGRPFSSAGNIACEKYLSLMMAEATPSRLALTTAARPGGFTQQHIAKFRGCIDFLSWFHRFVRCDHSVWSWL